MNPNAPTLSDLQDIVIPDPVSMFPLAPAGWVALVLLCLAAAWIVIYFFKQHNRNAYRRTALEELHRAQSATMIGAILRRVALKAHGRESVAALRGEAWFDWLGEAISTPMPEPARQALASIYSGDEVDPEPLRTYAERWIRSHSC